MAKKRKTRSVIIAESNADAEVLRAILAAMGRSFRGLPAEQPLDQPASLSLAGIVTAERKAVEGTLIKATGVVWNEVVRVLGNDWSRAFEIPPGKWEEIIAGAFDRAGFDQVILTPRSGDFGRDVVAIRNGVGTIKIIGSVKAYKPGHLVKHDDVRSLLGVLNGEQNASKAILTTTSDFAPRIRSDPFIKPYLPTRLELMNGKELLDWMLKLIKK
jgi:restriction system protein